MNCFQSFDISTLGPTPAEFIAAQDTFRRVFRVTFYDYDDLDNDIDDGEMMMKMRRMMIEMFSSISIDTTYYNGSLGLLKYKGSLEQKPNQKSLIFLVDFFVAEFW